MAEETAVVSVTYGGQQGTLTNPVPFDSTDEQIRQWAAEELREGVPGIDPQSISLDALDDFVVERYAAKEDLPNRLVVRPKVPFG